MTYIETLGSNAKKASVKIASASTGEKNVILENIAKALRENAGRIIEANKLDISKAKENGISDVMVDRLMLDEKRINAIADAVVALTKLGNPVGQVVGGHTHPNGMKIEKVRVPLGVIGIIYESRPNVTVDAAALCIKSGNSTILRGGKEAINSNILLVEIMREAIEKSGFPKDIVAIIEDTSRDVANEFMRCNKYVDVLIPRGGAGLINACVMNATVPVIETGTGNCHIFIDASADKEMAINITNNGKTQRPSVCNAVESLLVHKDIAEEILPLIKAKLDEHDVEIRGCEKTLSILGESDKVKLATEEDYDTEFLGYILSCKVVDDIDEAIEHISKYTTHHSECIITENFRNAEKFLGSIDAAAVYVNASTRFTDGEVFGLGAEIGISTQKLHARGPMGLSELTTIKYLIRGNGQIR
mgnify:FL=1